MDLDVQVLGGLCPVQGDGLINGHRWYFRARGESWSFEVWAEGVGIPVDPGADLGYELPQEESVFERGDEYNPGDQFGAGYMPDEDARRFIEESAQKFVEWKQAGGLVMYMSPAARRLRKRELVERRRRNIASTNWWKTLRTRETSP
jgi:hypothetical protein